MYVPVLMAYLLLLSRAIRAFPVLGVLLSGAFTCLSSAYTNQPVDTHTHTHTGVAHHGEVYER